MSDRANRDHEGAAILEKASSGDFNRMAFQLLTEFTFSTIQSLVDTSSSLRALELNRPYWSHAGKAAALNLKKALSLEKGDLSSVLFITQVVFSTFGIGLTLINDEVGYAVTTCPFRSGPPEFCVLFDVVMGNAFVEAIDPNHEFVVYEMMSQGSPYCRSVIRLRGNHETESTWGAMPKVQIPKEQLDDLAIQYLGEHWVMSTRAALDFENSPETMLSLKMRMRQLGISKALQFREMLGIKGSDAMTIGAVLDFCNTLLKQEGRTISSSSELIEKEIIQCPFRDAPVAICEQLETFKNGICEATNPEYEFACDRMMTKGDENCHWTIRKKGTADEEFIPDDPAKILATRFARGEITEEEFIRRMALLREHFRR